MITLTQTLLIILLFEPALLYFLYYRLRKKRNTLFEFYLIACYTVFGFSIFAAMVFQDLIMTMTNQLLTTTAIFFLGVTNIIMLLAIIIMYKKTEDQRKDITALTREVAYIKEKKRTKK